MRPGRRRKLGLGFVPEERLGRGAVPRMSLADNALLTAHRRGMLKHGLIDFKAVARVLARMHRQVQREVRRSVRRRRNRCRAAICRSSSSAARSCSSRSCSSSRSRPGAWMSAPRRSSGRRLIDLRNAGTAVLVISEELDELFEICDRIAVIANGRLSPAKRTADTNVEEIGVWMSGMWPGAESATAESAMWPRLEARPEALAMRCAMRRRSSRWRSRSSADSIIFAALGKNPIEGFRVFFLSPLKDCIRIAGAPAQGDAADADRRRPRRRLSRQRLEHRRRGPVHRRRDRRRTASRSTSRAARARSCCRRWSSPAPSAARCGRPIPALLRTKFNANEILVSLMLVYIAQLGVSWLVHGPWKDPEGFNFPQTKMFHDAALLPILVEGTRLNVGVPGRARARSPRATCSCNRSFIGFQMQVAGAGRSGRALCRLFREAA